MPQEKRKHPRLTLPLAAQIRLGGKPLRGTMENLSAGGARIRLTERAAAGTVLDEIRFTLPGSGKVPDFEIAAKAEIVHSEPLEQAEGEAGFLAGVQFLDLPEKDFRRIQQFVFQRLTGGSPDSGEIPLEQRRIDLERPISIRYDRFDSFVDEVSVNTSAGGMFIRTQHPRPPGTVFWFEFRLGEDFTLIEGRGEVVWTRRKRLDPEHPAGMGIRFLELDEQSRSTILALVKKRSERDPSDTLPVEGFEVAEVTSAPSTPPALANTTAPSPTSKPADAGAAETAAPSEGLRQELARRTRHYEERVGQLEAQIETLTAKLVDENTRLLQSQTSRDDIETLNATLQTQLEEAHQRLESERLDSGDRLKAAKREIEEMRAELKVWKFESETARRKMEDAENRADEIKQFLTRTETERDDLADRLRKFDDAEAARASAERRCHELEELLAEAKRNLETARVEHERIAVAAISREDLAVQEGTIRSLRRELEQATQESDFFRAEVAQLTAAAQSLEIESEERTPAAQATGTNLARAAGLVGAGLLIGALLSAAGSAFLPFGTSSPTPAASETGSESGGEIRVLAAGVAPSNDSVAAVRQEETKQPAPASSALFTNEPPDPNEAPFPDPLEVVQSWARAWSEQRVDDYLGHYSGDFVPSNGASYQAWAAYRRERVAAPESIEITLAKLRQQPLDNGRVAVTFEQAYRAGALADRVLKTLVLIRDEFSWKILSERSEPLG